MKKLFIVCVLFLYGCATPHASFEVEQLKTNEILGAGYEKLDGKLYHIFCGGNGYASYSFVKDHCMYNTAKFVYENGYNYFSMLTQTGDTDKSTGGYYSNGVYIPYDVVKHSQYYSILFLTKAETKKASNFYKVSDYYTPEETSSESQK